MKKKAPLKKPRSLLLGGFAAIVARAASKDAYRPLLTTVHMTNDALVATNSYRLRRLTLPENPPVCDFPSIKGRRPPEALSAPLNIPADDLLEAVGNIRSRKGLPILGRIAVIPNEDGTVDLTTTDLDTERTITTRPVEGVFPPYERLLPDDEDARAWVALDPTFLMDAAKAAKDFVGMNKTPLILKVYSPLKPVIITSSVDGQEMTELVMPVRADPASWQPSIPNYRDQRDELARAIALSLDDRNTAGKRGRRGIINEGLEKLLTRVMGPDYAEGIWQDAKAPEEES
jgi:DNA polymerase III sliding clamp (beta) subunit (PCNA family)